MRRRTKIPANFVKYFIAGIIFFGILFTWITYLSMVKPVDSKSQELVAFTVNKGESTLSIARRLQQAGLIRSVFGFRLEVKRMGLAGKLQAGDYQLTAAAPARAIAEALTMGYAAELKLTIPEGYRVEEIAEKVEAVLGISQKDFLAVAKKYEGYLFPDTYQFGSNTTAEAVVERMRTEFSNKTRTLKPTESQIILASLIERETKTMAEKPIVAGILQKRLDNNWPLQLDATMQYIVGKKGEWWPNTTLADRQRPSAYNTYLNQGLPPGPICNPGLESIKAAVSPQASNYWYYLHGRDGIIRYAATSAEHEQNIVRFLR